VELETEVRRLRSVGGRFQLETTGGPLEARTVVVATGGFHVPHRPAIAEQVPGTAVQLHSHEYRNASSLPPGAVLVVGSGQSGVQIAEELHDAGRRVFLSVGSAGRLPRRYRGSDSFRWLAEVAERGDALGTPLPAADRLPDPRLRLAGNPHCSGHGGGHDTNLRRFAAEGMTLLGRIQAVDGARLRLAPDLAVNLGWADRFFDERFRGLFDAFIERAGIDAPPDDRVPFDFEPPVLAEIDLERAGIATIVWTTGYRLDYGWVDLPIFDELGFPRQVGGASEVPGLFFLGSLWQSTQASSTLFGIGIDARRLAGAMGLRAVA
jgi:putative flavoprotein involved in K+ transport